MPSSPPRPNQPPETASVVRPQSGRSGRVVDASVQGRGSSAPEHVQQPCVFCKALVTQRVLFGSVSVSVCKKCLNTTAKVMKFVLMVTR